MASKIGNIKDLWSNLDSCIRDKTSWIELGSSITGGYPAMLKLLAEKAKECSQDPNTQYRTAVQLAELFGTTLPKQSDFGIKDDGTLPSKETDHRKDMVISPEELALTQHKTNAQQVTFTLLAQRCSMYSDTETNKCEPGIDGKFYLANSTRFAITDKQAADIYTKVYNEAMLVTDTADMTANGTQVAIEELKKLGIEFALSAEPLTGSGPRPAKSNTVAMAGMGLLGGAILLAGAWYIGKAVKIK